MRALALDLAIGTTGYAVIENALTDSIRVLPDGIGHFALPASDPKRNRADVGLMRARALAARVLTLSERFAVDWIAYEYPDKPRSLWAGGSHAGGGALQEFRTMQGLGLAEGILVALAGELLATRGVQMWAISTTEVRQFLLGTDYGGKSKIKAALDQRYGSPLTMGLTEDEVDALAVGVTALPSESPVSDQAEPPTIPAETIALADLTGLDAQDLQGAVFATHSTPLDYLKSEGYFAPPPPPRPKRSARVQCIIDHESQGNPNATNPRSGAAGLGQFLSSTWAGTPQGKAGLSPYNAAANEAAIAWMIEQGRAGEFNVVAVYGC